MRDGRRIRIYDGANALSFRSYLMLLDKDQDFGTWYTGVLAEVGYEAFFWEHPPLCTANIEFDAEFVLLDSPTLARLAPDPQPFKPHFEADNDIVAFRSLGGDALLIAPKPLEPIAACTHLAAFIRDAPPTRVQSLWHEAGRAVRESLSDRSLWLSTSGLGVAWLHIRLDTYPKYYQHRPYCRMSGPFGPG